MRHRGPRGKSAIAQAIHPVSLAHAAKALGVGESALYNYALGRRAVPGWLVDRFAREYDVDPDLWPEKE